MASFEIDDLRPDEFLLCLRNEAATFNDNARVRYLLLEAATRLERETSRGDAIERQAEKFAADLREAQNQIQDAYEHIGAQRSIAIASIDADMRLLQKASDGIISALGEREYRWEIPF